MPVVFVFRPLTASLVLIAAALLGQLAGCASYSAKVPAPIKAGGMPYVETLKAISFGADPYVQKERQQHAFGDDLLAAAVLPVRVSIENKGDLPVRIDPENFKLYLPAEQMTGSRPSHEVARLFAPTEGVADYATTGVGMLGGLAGPIGAVAGRIVALISASALGWSRSEALQARETDYAAKELKRARLGKNQTVRGFLFFILPRETPAFDEAMLALSVFRESEEVASFKLAMKGLGYHGPSLED